MAYVNCTGTRRMVCANPQSSPGSTDELTINSLEWLYIISGHGRATAFAGASTARTFDFQTGDTGVFPVSYGHYVRTGELAL